MQYTESVERLGLFHLRSIRADIPVPLLVEESLGRGESTLASNGALALFGERTGRSPQDKFIVRNASSARVFWGDVNTPMDPGVFDALLDLSRSYLQGRDLFVFNGYAGADPEYRLRIQVLSDFAWVALFSRTLFIPRDPWDDAGADADFTVVAMPKLAAPGYERLGLRSRAFVAIDFELRIVLIGGTEYAGEIKKSIFSVMNALMPVRDVLPMHCSANVGMRGDTALFFGLSGTGKTTLSADPARRLVGDDEHGWSPNGIFNFEGGCYAKCIKLSREAEPQIYGAIRFGSIIENVVLDENRDPDYDSDRLTENTRATYPVGHIANALVPGTAGHPKNIFFLAADAFGVLPPIVRLSNEEAMYHFLSGYTAKLAGTESGVKEPQATFSACFGAPFLPLHPFTYASMLGERLKKLGTRVWLVNTGWSGGPYGVGVRTPIHVTRALLSAALNGDLERTEYAPDPVFRFQTPLRCSGIPDELLNPRKTWQDLDAYEAAALALARRFASNFSAFSSKVSPEVVAAGPNIQG